MNSSKPVPQLRDAHSRFEAMLRPYPWLAKFWNFASSRPEVDRDALEKNRTVFSDSENILAAFFLSVWLGRNDDFDMLAAADKLDSSHRGVIAGWLSDPFWP